MRNINTHKPKCKVINKVIMEQFGYCIYHSCENCDNDELYYGIEGIRANYCPYCGKELDWSEVAEEIEKDNV